MHPAQENIQPAKMAEKIHLAPSAEKWRATGAK